MDRITNSFVEEFCSSFGYEEENPVHKYELFANYSIIAKHMANTTFSNTLQDVVNSTTYTDICFDGFAILLNGCLVSNQQEIDDILDSNQNIHAEFVVIETKSRLELRAVDQMKANVLMAFNPVYEEQEIGSFIQEDNNSLLQYVFSKNTLFVGKELPELHLYLVSDICDDNIRDQGLTELNKLENLFDNKNVFSHIYFNIWSNQQLIECYKKSKYSESIVISTSEMPIPFPKIDGASDSYIAMVPFSEFKKLIIDENGAIKSSVFHDNIRAFQGNRPANMAMAKSLANGLISEFVLKHNGITVIASNISFGSKELRLSDYQIVNGCQTCHVLYNNRDIPDIDNLQLIVKAIGSKDKRLRNEIIMGTNSQTEVKREQLMALSEVQERIEDFYNSVKDYERLYYERRSKQYLCETKVPQNKVITIPIEIYSFVSMFLGQPHNVTGYYSQVVDNIERTGKRVFSMDYKPDVYYTAGLAHYCVTRFMKEVHLQAKYTAFKFYLMYAFRLLVMPNSKMPELESSKIEDYCDSINKALTDRTLSRSVFSKAFEILKTSLGREPKRNDNMSKSLTLSIEKYIKALTDESDNTSDISQLLDKAISDETPNYIRTNNENTAIGSISRLINESKETICIHTGNCFSNVMNSEKIISSLRRFLNNGGSLNLLIYNYEEHLLHDSALFQMLAYMSSESKKIAVKMTKQQYTLKVSGKKMLYNIYLFDSIHERLELEDDFNTGRLWINQRKNIEKYQNLFESNFNSKSSININLMDEFNLNGI